MKSFCKGQWRIHRTITALLATCLLVIGFAAIVSGQDITPPPGGTNDPPTPEQLEAAWQAQLAALETNRQSILPYLHDGYTLPDGTPSDFQSIVNRSAADYAAAMPGSWQQSALDSALTWAWANSVPTEIPLAGEMDTKAHLVSIDEFPVYIMPYNVDAAQTIGTDKVWPGGAAGLGLNGTNKTVFMWDEGQPRLTHSEYSNRVSTLGGNTALNKHSTAVVGTLLAGGINNISSNGINIGAEAKGMSFAAKALAGNFQLDFSQMPGEAGTNNMRLSNHSYGHSTGWVLGANGWYWFGNSEVSTNQDPKFGGYTVYSAFLDQLAQSAPTYLGVWAAGNDVGTVPPVQPTNHTEFNLQTGLPYTTNRVHPANGDAGGYDTVSDLGCAKNTLTVGAVFPIYGGYIAPSNVVWASFSSCGPTDDGRIKPDVVADGVNVITCNYSNDFSYGSFPGTSFSTPSVAGSVNLLSQYHKQLSPNAPDMLSSTLKGLVIHTADQGTTNAGPSYRLGWGLMNTARAAGQLANNATNGLKSFIKEIMLVNGAYAQFPIVSAGTNALKVTMCWIDPAGAANAVTNLDNIANKLVNDLDLRVITPAGTTNFPWVLNPDLTNQTSAARGISAATGDDTRNNVEQVYILNPTTNTTYLVRVTHKGTLTNSQWLSVLVSGIIPQPVPPLVFNQVLQVATNQMALGWASVVGQRYQVQMVTALGTSNNWQNVGAEISARLTNVVVQVPKTNPQTFYRLVQLP